MGKRSFQVPTWNPGAAGFADTSALSNNNYMCVGAINNLTALLVSEIYIGGQATSSAVNIMMFARDSTISATPTALAAPASDGPLLSQSPATATNSVVNNFAGTAPQRSATVTSARLNLSLNSFGGIVRWVAYPGEEWGISSNVASISESSLSAFTGTPGLVGAHIIYETFAS